MSLLKKLFDGNPPAIPATSAIRGAVNSGNSKNSKGGSRFDRLAALAAEMGIGGDLLDRCRRDDLSWITTRQQARRFLQVVAEQSERERGVVPASHTAQAHCQRCGPVLLRPGLVAALDKVDGTPTAACCPWCVAGRLS